MSKTNYLQTVLSDLQRTAGPYRCANTGSDRAATITSSVSARWSDVRSTPTNAHQRAPLSRKYQRATNAK